MRRNKDFIYGRLPVAEMLHEGKRFERIILQRGIDPEFTSELKRLAGELGVPVQIVPRARLERLVRGNHQGIIAFTAWVEYLKLEDVIPFTYEQGQVPLFVLLDGVTDVRNIGAIARSAEALGATALVLPSRGSAMLNADAVKTSAGALTRLPVCREQSIGHACQQLQTHGIVVGAAVDSSSRAVDEVDWTAPSAFVLGSEGSGVHVSVRGKVDFEFGIPQQGEMDSLNVSVAAGIVLYEVSRQRKTL